MSKSGSFGVNQATSDKLSALKETYIKRLQQEFDAHYSAAQEPINQVTAVRLKAYLHKLAGSGGSFGFANLSALSKAAELVLEHAIENTQNSRSPNEYLTKKELQNLHKLFDEIRNEVRQASTSFHPAAAENEEVIELNTEVDPVVWLLDDDKFTVDGLARQLSSFGFDVTVFYTFNSFLEASKKSTPAFVIADVHLHKNKTVFQLWTQNNVHLAGSELIIMSADDRFDLRLDAVRQNAASFLKKPVDTNKLAHFLRERSIQSDVPPERVLLVDDDDDLAQLYKLYLSSVGMEVQTLNKPEEVIEYVKAFQPEIIVIDLYMPNIDGSEIAAMIRQYEELAVVPVVYLSSETRNREIAQALTRGGDDFLTKPIDEYALSTAIRVRVRRARQLRKLIQFDSLTGLLKHSAIKDATRKALERNRRTKSSVVVAMIDIDFFKKVNDNYGHATGDTVIAGLSTLLNQRIRRTDDVGRYGGEEFLAVLPDCDATSGQKILDDIRTRFENIKFVCGKETFNCTLSAGFTVIDQASGLDISEETAIDRADQALYVAKKNGRNRIEHYQKS